MGESALLDALFRSLDLAALEGTDAGEFVLIADPPAWFLDFFPERSVAGDRVELIARFPFLEHFVVDAAAVWSATAATPSLKSGPWLEAGDDGQTRLLEAIAVGLGSRRVLLIEAETSDLSKLQQVIQRGREQSLELLGERRAASALRQQRDELEEICLRAQHALARAEEQLRHAAKMEAVGRLAGGIAHDFNNLLTAILGHCELALEEMAPDDRGRFDVERIRREAERASALTRQLLMFSRRQKHEPTLLDLRSLVRHTSDLLCRVIGESIRLDLAMTSDLWPVLVDAGKLEQLIVNLAVNARDAMPGGGTLTLATENRVVIEPMPLASGTLAPGDYVVLEVSDTGVGIDPAIAGRIFEPFFTTKPGTKGTGLGLSVVHAIVEQSGGHIGVRSDRSAGTTFSVFLPRAAGNPAEKPRETRPAQPRGGDETIVVVEDEAPVRELMVSALTARGYTVLAAATAEDALALSRQVSARRIDLLITDVVLPGMGGPQLAEALKLSRPDVTVLYISGYTDDVRLPGGLEQTDAFLQKPFRPADLLDRTRRCLDRRR